MVVGGGGVPCGQGYLGCLPDNDSPFAKLIARRVSQHGCACLCHVLPFPLLGASRVPHVINQNRCSAAKLKYLSGDGEGG